jgi:hypothetical protein
VNKAGIPSVWTNDTALNADEAAAFALGGADADRPGIVPSARQLGKLFRNGYVHLSRQYTLSVRIGPQKSFFDVSCISHIFTI